MWSALTGVEGLQPCVHRLGASNNSRIFALREFDRSCQRKQKFGRHVLTSTSQLGMKVEHRDAAIKKVIHLIDQLNMF